MIERQREKVHISNGCWKHMEWVDHQNIFFPIYFKRKFIMLNHIYMIYMTNISRNALVESPWKSDGLTDR